MRYVVLAHRGESEWEHLGATDVSDDLPERDRAGAAIKALAEEAGGHVAIPFDDWAVFEVETSITVRPLLPRASASDDPGPIRMEGESDEAFAARGGFIEDDMEGMTQGPPIS